MIVTLCQNEVKTIEEDLKVLWKNVVIFAASYLISLYLSFSVAKCKVSFLKQLLLKIFPIFLAFGGQRLKQFWQFVSSLPNWMHCKGLSLWLSFSVSPNFHRLAKRNFVTLSCWQDFRKLHSGEIKKYIVQSNRMKTQEDSLNTHLDKWDALKM